jgi:hypothetical protein
MMVRFDVDGLTSGDVQLRHFFVLFSPGGQWSVTPSLRAPARNPGR